MFDFLENQSFVEFVLERGSIPFVVRGDLTCSANFTFDWGDWGIRISRPTYRVKVYGENPTSQEDEPLVNVHFHELTGETVFPGEIELPERSKRGIELALRAIEIWADFLCLANGNPKIQVEIQLPVQAIIVAKRELRADDLTRWAELVSYHASLSEPEKTQVENALWWYRKGCAAIKYSLFNGYTAYWNCLEILCGVSGSKIRKGEQVDAKIQEYLENKRKVKTKHIVHCYNAFVNYSIKAQVEDALRDLLGAEQGERWAFYCFSVQPSKDQLYQIRNDINHGNIRENNRDDYERVYLRGLLLRWLIFQILNKKLGRAVGLGKQDNIDILVNDILDYPK